MKQIFCALLSLFHFYLNVLQSIFLSIIIQKFYLVLQEKMFAINQSHERFNHGSGQYSKVDADDCL